MSDFISSRLKGYYLIVDGTKVPAQPLARRGAIEIRGAGVKVEDSSDGRTILTIPAGITADAIGGLQTTDDTPTLLTSISVAPETGYRLQVDVQGLNVADRKEGYAKSWHVSARRSGVGGVQVSGIDEISADVSAALSTVVVALQASGGDFQVLVTSVDTLDVDWTARIRVLVG